MIAQLQAAAIPITYLLAATLFIGCNEQGSQAPVSGIVTLDGQPLAKAGITFTPTRDGRPAWATTDERGEFTLSTHTTGDGALVGEHIVTIDKSNDTPPEQVEEVADQGLASIAALGSDRKGVSGGVVPAKYSSRKTSDLRFLVEAGKHNTADMMLSSRP